MNTTNDPSALCGQPSHAWWGKYEGEPYTVRGPVTDKPVAYINLHCGKCGRIAGARLVRRSDVFHAAIDHLTEIITNLDDLTMWARAELPSHAVDVELTALRSAYSTLCHDILAYRDVAIENDDIEDLAASDEAIRATFDQDVM